MATSEEKKEALVLGLTNNFDLLRSLRNSGVLQDVKPELINLVNGAIILPCPDGDYFDNLYMFCRGMFISKGLNPRIHPLTEHGGTLVLPPNSPLNIDNLGEKLLQKIRDANAMKGITTVISHAHTPCGAAKKAGLSLFEQIKLHIEADDLIQNELPGFQAVCLFQVFWKDRIRIYYVSGTKWREYLK